MGIGGIGMSALAQWFQAKGFKVGGYDKTSTPLTQYLEKLNIDIHYDDKVGRIPTSFYKKNETLVVLTPAIPLDNIERKYFETENYNIVKRSKVLGLICKNQYTIAVAGTHGKTTTGSMIAHIFENAGMQPNAFIGGIMTNYNSNLLISQKKDTNTVCIVEADEYDRSFLALYPDIAVVTSADADHLDIYGAHSELIQSFEDFISNIKNDGKLFINHSLTLRIPQYLSTLRYSTQLSDCYVDNLRIVNGNFIFDYVSQSCNILQVQLVVPGIHNVSNAIAAMSVGLAYGIAPHLVKQGIESYKGVKRRFEYIIKSDRITFIDDYAHHPTEIEALLSAVKMLYPTATITCVFQPHLYTRTRDFADGFSKSLSLANEVILLPIYPARELPIPGVSAQMLLNNISSAKKCIMQKDEVVTHFANHHAEVILTVGAGDIDTVVTPLKNMLLQKYF
ncbi:MAG: UDP-N-acetylmuramate--L-alanine ligase [Cytophagales bacterium]|nr:UDP-N-acetylmuramate--L-alanine ligase [Cytophagales bacterium]